MKGTVHYFLSLFQYCNEVTQVWLQLTDIFRTLVNLPDLPIIMSNFGGVSLVKNLWPEWPSICCRPNSPPYFGFWGLLDTRMSNKKYYIQNWQQTKKISWGVLHQNTIRAQIWLTHLFLVNSVIASDDLIKLVDIGRCYCFSSRTWLMPPVCFEHVKWCMAGGKWHGSNYIFTFLNSFTVSTKSSSLTSDTMGV